MMIDVTLVRRLVASQFPQLKNLIIKPVEASGWDNRTFHLGQNMLIRMPSSLDYAPQVEKEQKWLPQLAAALPLKIPKPIAMGHPEFTYPCKWSIYEWIDGKPARIEEIDNLVEFAIDLGNFLKALHKIETLGGPEPGIHSFYRGGSLAVYDEQTRKAISIIKNTTDTSQLIQIWEKALMSQWEKKPVFVHGDISAGNLLTKNGKLHAVIDFGQLSIGDPACDLAIAWTFFHGKSRKSFHEKISLDTHTWARARGWTLWKALIAAAGLTNPNNKESQECWRILENLIEDFENEN